MGNRNSGVCGSGDASGDACNDLERHRCVVESLGFLAATAEHERVAALETNDALAFARELDEKRVDLALAHGGFRSAAFPDVIQLGQARLARTGRKERCTGERIINDCVG
jgi:hypothetical protein